jgi:RNA polymerase sigma factor (sigma-70 family)
MFEGRKMSASELVNGLQTQCDVAYATLYNDYAPTLFGVAFKILNDKTIVEDLLQDIFVKIWKHVHTYDPEKGALFTWMLNITRNTCKDYLRSKQYKNQTLTVNDTLESIPSKYIPHTTNMSEVTLDAEIIRQKLESKYKEIIDLIYLDGYSHLEVSFILDIPLGTVKTRSRAALKRLRYIHPSPV